MLLERVQIAEQAVKLLGLWALLTALGFLYGFGEGRQAVYRFPCSNVTTRITHHSDFSRTRFHTDTTTLPAPCEPTDAP